MRFAVCRQIRGTVDGPCVACRRTVGRVRAMADQQFFPRAAESSPVRSSDPGLPTRLAGQLIGKPVLAFILVPGLVLLAGAALVVLGHRSLLRSTEAALRERVSDEATQAIRATESVLGKASALIASLDTWLLAHPGAGPEDFARHAHPLSLQRGGLAAVGFGRTDGSFMSVATDQADQADLRLIHSWIGEDGVAIQQVSRLQGGAASLLETSRDSGYDPRQRPFWAPAVAASGPVWTQPYIFHRSRQLGITCAQALRDPASGVLRGVAIADYNLSTLSRFLEGIAAGGAPGTAVFLFSADGQVLATSTPATGFEERRAALRKALLARLPAVGSLAHHDLRIGGDEVLCSVGAVRIGDGPVWYVGAAAPRAVLIAAAEDHLRSTLWAGLAILVVAVGLGAMLAHYLTRQRRIASDARADAQAARVRLREMGSYALVRLLGSGGMGEVWQAEHRMLARPAALKLIKLDEFAATPEERQTAVARFAREAKATASLRSRNTITLYDFGLAADGSFFYAMELLDGLDLDALVVRHGPQPAGRVVDILIQVCGSLSEAHRSGMIHRDIKPANIFLCRCGDEVDVVKVLDFGLVFDRRAPDSQISRPGMVQGTPAFMAPEQARGQPLDGRADLYAVGCVAWWLLTGKLPFDRTDPIALLLDHIGTTPPDIRAAASEPVPDGLAEVVMRLLAKSPADRYPDATALADDLRRLPMPEAQRWDRARAAAWWDEHRPAGQSAVGAPVPSGAAPRLDVRPSFAGG
jgi:hypothetical protein